MKRTIEILLSLILSLVPLTALSDSGQQLGYGLRIQSYPAATKEYTTILLDNGDPIATQGKEIRLEMDIWAYPESAFGSICRVLSDNDSNIDLMYSVGKDYVRYPMLVTGDNDMLQKSPVNYGEWNHAVISMNPMTGKVSLNYNGEVTETVYEAFKGTSSIRIAAGLCKLSDYLLFDVASVAIKDVAIYRGNDEIRFWKMERHSGNICYDEIDNAPATVENANWIIDETATWENIYTAQFPYFPSIAFDPRVATFYLAYNGDKRLFVYHANEGATDTIATKGGEYVANFPNQLIYISQLNELLSYNLDEDLYSTFDPCDQNWSSRKKSTKQHGYWNNTIVYDPSDSSLVSFGGYGYFHYNNTLLRSYPFSNKPQSAVTLKDIDPRYSCSSVLVDSLLYIFAGRGCPSGRQELAPRNYYDMYRVNLHNNNVEKLWSDNVSPAGKGIEFIPGENMIYEKETNSLFIWTTMGGGMLYKVGIDTGKFEPMSLPMGGDINSQTLYCNLYFSAPQKSFYAVIINSDVQGVSVVNIFRLAYPPVPISSLTQDPENLGTKDKSHLPAIIIALCILASCVAFAVWMRRKRKTNVLEPKPAVTAIQSAERGNNEQTSNVEDSKPKDSNEASETSLTTEEQSNSSTQSNLQIDTETAFYDLDKGCVRFLGGFRVFDKKGEDITPLFTPTLKQLLILLILYTGKSPLGIPNNKLLSILWNDKEEEAAKNNRNVYMSRLRNLLTQIGDVTIQTHNGYRSIDFGNGSLCDYLEALRLFKESDNADLDRLLELLFNGMMLPNVELDYVDSFKSEFSNQTIDLLSGLIKEPNLSNSIKLKIADTLFQHDYINEEALKVKCSILHVQGRTGLAQAAYTSFCKEYKAIIGSDYPHSLTEIIKNGQSK